MSEKERDWFSEFFTILFILLKILKKYFTYTYIIIIFFAYDVGFLCFENFIVSLLNFIYNVWTWPSPRINFDIGQNSTMHRVLPPDKQIHVISPVVGLVKLSMLKDRTVVPYVTLQMNITNYCRMWYYQ